ncbi:ABC transporter ATP-binding protein [bacterium]|nr:ABC transporter ATP-binding protein [bacterium]
MRVVLENVSKKFGSVLAVEEVSFEVEEGELFFLLGPSGCGKTTLLRLIAGFISPDRGKILFGEKLMNEVPPNRRNTGMVFQNYALWPHMTVRKNVEYGLRVRKIPSRERLKAVDEVLSLVRMSGFGDRYPNELSGGQQQRVALARVLVVRPDVLLLDEPLSNLDAKLRIEMRDEIRRIHKESGITFVYVTHDQKEALSMADRIALMNEGRIEQIGTPRDIYSAPKSKFTAMFLGRMNPIPGRVVRVTPGGEIVVGTAVGEIRTDKPVEEVSVGEDVECLIRPEAMRILSEEWALAGERNVLKGTVVDHAYLGEIDEFQVQLVDGSKVRVYVASSESKGVERKKEVAVAFDVGDVLLCKPSSGLAGEER